MVEGHRHGEEEEEGHLRMTRREDWPERLAEVLEHHAALPMAWGASDCLLLPADAVLAMTGEDPAAEARGHYRTERGAARLLRGRGWTSVADAFASRFPEIPVAMAGRGDLGVVTVPYGAGFAGVVFMGSGAFGKNADAPGNLFVPRSAIVRAFKV
jgi:hypothetical protein